MSSLISKRLISVEDYYKMAACGVLKREERLELIDGEILIKYLSSAQHSGHIKRINAFLHHMKIPTIVSIKHPVRFNKFTEPEPDIALLRYRDDFYVEKHPTPDDVFLIIEVSDLSLEFDHQVKLPLYAKAEIPEYWLVNLEKSVIEVFKFPKHGSYSSREIKYKEDTILVKEFGIEIKVAEILY